MVQDVQEDLIQSRVEQLKAIAARRNDLLREMYHLVRHRDNMGSIIQVEEHPDGDEDEDCNQFLLKFDLRKHGENGCVTNHLDSSWKVKEEDRTESIQAPPDNISMTAPPKANPIQTTQQSTSASVPGEATGTTTGQEGPSDAGNDLPVTGTRVSQGLTKEEIDDDRDELDLIGSTDKDGTGSSSPSKAHPEPSDQQRDSSQSAAPPPSSSPSLQSLPASSSQVQSLGQADQEPTKGMSSDVSMVDVSEESVKGNATTVNPLAVYKPSVSSSIFVQPTPNPVIIPEPLAPSVSKDQYDIQQPPPPEPKVEPSSPVLRYGIKTEYTLPSLQILPPEFTRKKSSKRRKDRERPEKSQKDDGVPMGINRWAAMLNANPLYKRVARSTKCLSTKEWSVAIAELRLIRTAERIEVLKSQARWGLRQIKKQRGVGGLLKTHWDYLLDEMKWMRTDFREERKWKLAVAYQLSTSVLEWHSLKNFEERVQHGVCVKWRPHEPVTLDDNQVDSQSMDIDMESSGNDPEANPVPSNSILGLDYASDNEDMDGDSEKQLEVMDPLETGNAIKDALDGADEARMKEAEPTPMEEVKLKTEEIDDTVALQGPMVVDTAQAEALEKSALKSTSNDPLLGSKSSSHSLNGDGDEKPPSTKTKIAAYAPIREKLVYESEGKLFIEPEDLHIPDQEDTDSLRQLDISSIFPDLQPFAMFDVAPATEPKKKNRIERDDPNKRLEETNYTKVFPSGQFMFVKPTLLGPLQPAKRWKDGSWLPMEENPIPSEPESGSTSVKNLEESVSELFDFKIKTSGPALPPQARDARRAKVDQYWSTNDDLLLKSLVDKYPGNWNLIAECFNGCRKTTPSDRRTPTDCMDRWKVKWGMDLLTKDNPQGNSEDQSPPTGVQASSSNDISMSNSTPSVAAGPSVTTRGVRRLASASVSSQVAPSVSAGNEPKKRRRHLLLQETIRKTNRKKADQQAKQLANQRKTPGMHETHIQYTKLPRLSPMELSRLKAERDAAQLAEIQKARARQEELKKQLSGIPIPPQAGQPQPGPQTPVPHAQGGQPQPLTQQQQLQLQAQLQANQARAGSVGAPGTRPGSVNIARMSTPTGVAVAGPPRLTSQQVLQLQQRLAAGTGQTALNAATVNLANGLVNSQFGNRDATASPATHGVNSPHLAPSSGNAAVNPPRSPHDPAAVNAAVGQAMNAVGAANGAQRAAFNLQFQNGQTQNLHPDQINALRIHMLSQLQQHQAQGSAGPAQPQPQSQPQPQPPAQS
ncbi:hypothetical protein CC2G_005773 [Coprinopsis cinerea AmutBmut pab1-1]|nr:hypothetical protein CC2G_005773 [Coprinopsis cinerea AmutBmut pab1-1]